MQPKKPYVSPDFIIHGSVKKITQQGQGGFNKPFDCGDGNSGTQGNASCNTGGGAFS